MPGSGIIIFPVEQTDGLLAAAVFHSTPIPEFTTSDRRPAYSSMYNDFAPQSPTSATSTSSMQSWPRSPTPSYTLSPSASLVYNGNSTWAGESYSSPPYAVPRSHFLHQLSIPPTDIEAAQRSQFSSPLTSSDVLEFDWTDSRTHSNDVPDQLHYNLLSASDPDWNFLNPSYTLTSP